jgi:hypothetical protein
MKTLINSVSALTTLVAALTLSAGAAQANTSESTLQRIEIGGIMLAAPASEIEGMFKLSNGKILQLSRSDYGVMAQMNGGVTRELVPVAANRLRSRDGRLELAFSVQPDGSVTDIKLSMARA